MNPFTITSLLSYVHEVAILLQQFYETVKDAPKALAIVANQASVFEQELDRLSSIERQLPTDKREYLQKQVNNDECRLTIGQLKSLVEKIPAWDSYSNKSETDQARESMKLKDRIALLRKKDEFQELGAKLARQADRVRDTMLVTIVDYVVGIKEDTKLLREAFPRVNPAIANSDSSGVFSPFLDDDVTWHGQFWRKPGRDNKLPYIRDRDKLASANYSGDWTGTMGLLAHTSQVYNQNWVNCWRINPAGRIPSGYTALHQAAWHGAPKATVEKLIHMGAWKLARTIRDGSSSTPLDVARQHGWTHLYDILNPVIRRPLHYKILDNLQTRLHELIRESFKNDPEAHLECLVLPELEILTDFDHSRLWFPLQPELKDTRKGLAVQIILDGQELVVTVQRGTVERKLYRISTQETKEINQALVLRS